jgi:hypothetical protein
MLEVQILGGRKVVSGKVFRSNARRGGSKEGSPKFVRPMSPSNIQRGKPADICWLEGGEGGYAILNSTLPKN